MAEYTEVSRFSKEEELANAASHFLGAILGIVALVLMLIKSNEFGDGIHIISTGVFGVSMIILYVSSTMTHYLKQGPVKNFFFTLDKIAIYFLIAGTYTPLALLAVKGGLGWVMFGIEWACAFGGSYLILRNPVNFEKGVNTLTVATYAAMGWLILVAIIPIIKVLPTMGWLLIFIGGLSYTIGIYFYKKCSFRHHHLVWHLFVLGGTIAHFLTIYIYVIPL